MLLEWTGWNAGKEPFRLPFEGIASVTPWPLTLESSSQRPTCRSRTTKPAAAWHPRWSCWTPGVIRYGAAVGGSRSLLSQAVVRPTAAGFSLPLNSFFFFFKSFMERQTVLHPGASCIKSFFFLLYFLTLTVLRKLKLAVNLYTKKMHNLFFKT